MPAQLKDDRFDMLFHSPLTRADQTAQIIWGSREGAVTVLPSLREVDLYSFQVRVLRHALHKPVTYPCKPEYLTDMDQADKPACSHALCRDS